MVFFKQHKCSDCDDMVPGGVVTCAGCTSKAMEKFGPNFKSSTVKDVEKIMDWQAGKHLEKLNKAAQQFVTDVALGIDTDPIEDDNVNQPPHYTWHPKGIECLDVIEEFDSYNISAAMKYLFRNGRKGNTEDAIKDLKKAMFHIERELSRLTHDSD